MTQSGPSGPAPQTCCRPNGQLTSVYTLSNQQLKALGKYHADLKNCRAGFRRLVGNLFN